MSAADVSLPSRSSWYAEGLRWIGSLFISAADTLDRPSFAPSPLEPRPKHVAAEEFLFDVRSRIYSGFGHGHHTYY